MATLHLTTPHIRGPKVSQLQAELLRAGWYQGKVDGEYGPLTAQAVYRAKFWLGYLKPDKTAGASFERMLTGKAKPSAGMVKIRRERMIHKHIKPPVSKILTVARSQIGVRENPAGSNRVKYSEWYGMIGPWCAMFCSWCAFKAGLKFRYAYVPYVVADARAGKNGLTVTLNPHPGDFVCYDWNKDGVADHIGIFEGWVKPELGTFYAVEGNTGLGNDSNGGEVMRMQRSRSEVQAFVHISGGY